MWLNGQNNKNTDCIESLYKTKQAIVAFFPMLFVKVHAVRRWTSYWVEMATQLSHKKAALFHNR